MAAGRLLLQPTDLPLRNFASPFAAFFVPDPNVVFYAVAYGVGALLLAVLAFNRRDL